MQGTGGALVEDQAGVVEEELVISFGVDQVVGYGVLSFLSV